MGPRLPLRAADSPDAAVRGVHDALSAGDVAGALSHYADDAVLDLDGRPVSGAQLRGLLVWLAGLKAPIRLELTGVTRTAGTTEREVSGRWSVSARTADGCDLDLAMALHATVQALPSGGWRIVRDSWHASPCTPSASPGRADEVWRSRTPT